MYYFMNGNPLYAIEYIIQQSQLLKGRDISLSTEEVNNRSLIFVNKGSALR